MKKTLIALTLAAVLPAAVLASGSERGERHHGPDIERLSEQLELSDEQRSRMRALFEEQATKRRAMRDEMRSRMAEVLTPEQQSKMKEMHEDRREHRREGYGRRHGGRGDCYGGEERSS